MTYNRLPKNTPAILRAAGLTVVGTDGWWARGRPNNTGDFNPVGVLCHHTATGPKTPDSAVVRLLVDGRSDLPGPLCQFGLSREGIVYLIAGGRANHAGKAKRSGSVPAGDGNELYYGIEAFNDGVGEAWTPKQLNAYALLCAVLSKEFTKGDSASVRGHKETSVTGKIDPTFDMKNFRKKVDQKLKELEDGKEMTVEELDAYLKSPKGQKVLQDAVRSTLIPMPNNTPKEWTLGTILRTLVNRK